MARLRFVWRSVSLSIIGSLGLLNACGDDDDSTGGTGGGSNAAGGAVSANGGSTTANGGVTAKGGAVATDGGATAKGGAAANGGAASGGAPGSEGGATTTGGVGTEGGTTSTGGANVGGSGGEGGGESTTADAKMNFFITSDTKADANLGGLTGADARCQRLAAAVGHGSKTWRAYLSAETPATNARDRIGAGPYYNSKGDLLAADKTALHARPGDAAVFLDEKGNRINGQWSGSPTPNQHDILTGTLADGTVSAGLTCGDWTATTGNSQVGHSDGLGPGMATTGTYTVWNASHTGNCGNTTPGGGAGKLYCFVGP